MTAQRVDEFLRGLAWNASGILLAQAILALGHPSWSTPDPWVCAAAALVVAIGSLPLLTGAHRAHHPLIKAFVLGQVAGTLLALPLIPLLPHAAVIF